MWETLGSGEEDRRQVDQAEGFSASPKSDQRGKVQLEIHGSRQGKTPRLQMDGLQSSGSSIPRVKPPATATATAKPEMSSGEVSKVKFKACNLALCLDKWKTISTCKWTAQMVAGLKIPFDTLPIQINRPFPFKLYTSDRNIFTQQVELLLAKQVVLPVSYTEGEFISNVFLRPKPNGDFRMILDLTLLNHHVGYKTLQDVFASQSERFSLEWSIDG